MSLSLARNENFILSSHIRFSVSGATVPPRKDNRCRVVALYGPAIPSSATCGGKLFSSFLPSCRTRQKLVSGGACSPSITYKYTLTRMEFFSSPRCSRDEGVGRFLQLGAITEVHRLPRAPCEPGSSLSRIGGCPVQDLDEKGSWLEVKLLVWRNGYKQRWYYVRAKMIRGTGTRMPHVLWASTIV